MRLRSHAIPETRLNEEVMSMVASGAGVSGEELQSRLDAQTLLRRLPTLAELSELTVFLASDRASGMTASTTNLSLGAIAD